MADDQVDTVLAVLRDVLDEATLLGAAVYGSIVDGGLRPDSDLDTLAITARPISADEKQALVRGLVPISSRAMRPPGWRPVELTVVAQGEVRPWRYPPRIELQYGEWLRDNFAAGVDEPWRNPNPDLAVVLTMARANARTISGRRMVELLDPVPRADLVRAMLDEIPGLLEDLEADTRNVLLTLARMWSTIATGEIRSKDAAADWALARLPPAHRSVLARSRDLYRDGGYGEWTDAMGAVRAHADHVVAEIRRRGSQPMP